MVKKGKFKAIRRALLAALAATVMVGGVTFAILQSQQVKATGNIIQTATANLLVSTDGSSYAAAAPGFTFNNIVPGGTAVPTSGYPVYLKNSGNAPLVLKLSVSSALSNPENVDLSKVSIILTKPSGTPQTFPLKSLVDANATGGVTLTDPAQLFVGNTAQYNIQASMTADAVSNSTATIGNVDFAFSGIAQ